VIGGLWLGLGLGLGPEMKSNPEEDGDVLEAGSSCCVGNKDSGDELSTRLSNNDPCESLSYFVSSGSSLSSKLVGTGAAGDDPGLR